MRTIFCLGEQKPRKGKKLLIRYKAINGEGILCEIATQTEAIKAVRKIRGISGQELYEFITETTHYYYQHMNV